ncbi:ABC transporter ATP-binding protein [Tessaracoccus caeni]|uniref:ABC transporter ATP-binding protein n=1 Tax=Tessaracoccus caeni TaxID=3031239 RepID=UPI0023DA43D0|nr:ABC transporter ATP-binding protein [Tessaracoccus caeni]MDF1488216.1 ABC transporter ATP-binding protein [Tessaracoccus caeni]
MTTTQLHQSPRTTRTDDAIVVRNLRRSYRAPQRSLFPGSKAPEPFEAVKGIDLTVRRGEVFALLGTNGAGKTSTVELIEGLASPSAGSIQVLGHDPVRERDAVRHRTGVVLQSSGFPPALTAREIARMWHGTLTRPLPVDDVLASVDLSDRADVESAKLSGGERRRLDIALAIMGRPEVLILDEPTTGLDPESRRNIWTLIEHLVGQGTSLLLTTHYLEEAERLADRIAIMHRGLIAREGSLAEIVAESPARISFARPSSLALSDLTVPGANITVDDAVLIETPTLQDSLRRVLDWAGSTQLTGLDARSATLEQVFLSIADTH